MSSFSPSMTATFATLPLDMILSISAFLSSPLDVFSLSQTCRSALLASQAWASYWSKSVPVAHLLRPAPWQSYSPNELRDAHVRYAASRRGWESPSPGFKPPIRLPPPQDPNSGQDVSLRWRTIRGTRWAWSLQRSAGEISFCDLRTGLVIGQWNARGWVTNALIESRSPNHWVLCHWKANRADITTGTGFELVATSVTLEQDNSPIKMSFRTTKRTPLEKETSLSGGPMVIWRDYLIGPYIRPRNKRAYGLLLWNMRESNVYYFEMSFVPSRLKVRDDLLFIRLELPGAHRSTYHCIHIPTLVISTQLPGGSLDLTEIAYAELPPECRMDTHTAGSIGSFHEEIYSIPSSLPTHPRYCFILSQSMTVGMDWNILEVEINLSIPGPIKTFSRVSRQYAVPRPSYFFHNSDDDLLLSLPLEHGRIPRGPLSLRFLRVGTPDNWRVAKLEGMDNMCIVGLHVDKDAGYIIAWVREGRLWWTRESSFIWWIDQRKPSHMVHSPVMDLISGWSRGLLGF